MADTIGIVTGTGATIATDDISGTHYQRVKLVFGADGTNAGDVSWANPLPVEDHPVGTDHQQGHASATGTSNTSVISAPGTGTYLYVTNVQVHNSSTTDTFVSLLDGTTTRSVLPAPGKGGAAFECLIRCGTGSAFQFASGTSVSTMYVSAQGFKSVT